MNRAALRAWLDETPVSTQARLVYLVLMAHANTAGWAYPSVPTLAAMTGAGTTGVRLALRELTAVGDVTPQFRTGLPTLYRLTNPNAWRWGSDDTPTENGLNPNGKGPKPQRLALPKAFEGIEGIPLDPSTVELGRTGTTDARAALREARKAKK